jgi:hypothetical protein
MSWGLSRSRAGLWCGVRFSVWEVRDWDPDLDRGGESGRRCEREWMVRPGGVGDLESEKGL